MRPSRELLILLCATLVGCAPDAARSGNDRGYRGVVIPEPRAKPAFTLTDTRGEPFDFRERTRGYLTLVFFGYTYCPDICPVHMANLGAVMKELRPSVSRRIRVVFVTTDPARDTPERLERWLRNFHPDFIGLTGDFDRINEIQQTMGLPPAQLGVPDSATGSYLVGHSAYVVAFTPDGLGRVLYPFGTRQADWAHDLPKLLEDEWDDS